VVPPGLPLHLVVDGAVPGFHDLFRAQLGEHDAPLLQWLQTQVLPFDIVDIGSHDTGGAGLLSHCASLGVRQGMGVPLHGPRASGGVLVLMAGDYPRPLRLGEEGLRHAHWLATRMLARLLPDLIAAGARRKKAQLTSRQRAALRLSARGHSLDRVAMGLDVHPSTARYLIGRAVDKLQVPSRAEAIARAAALGEFDLAPELHCVRLPCLPCESLVGRRAAA
jgi:DNA-binding CsgD family transcriptional regulator